MHRKVSLSPGPVSPISPLAVNFPVSSLYDSSFHVCTTQTDTILKAYHQARTFINNLAFKRFIQIELIHIHGSCEDWSSEEVSLVGGKGKKALKNGQEAS